MILSSHHHEGLVIGFVNVSHAVQEQDSDFVFNMTLFKTLESEQTYSLVLGGIVGSAGVDDFTAPGEVFLFPPESETLTVYVNITGDTRIELTEEFMMRIVPLEGPPFGFEEATVTATVNIVDNDGGKSLYYILYLLLPVAIKVYVTD